MTVRISSYRDLKVWQLGIDRVVDVYHACESLPKQEMYGLASQMQRSSVSIPANIAEGHERGSTREYVRHVGIAQGSRAELETHLIIAERLKFISSTKVTGLLNDLGDLGKMLNGLQRALNARLDD